MKHSKSLNNYTAGTIKPTSRNHSLQTQVSIVYNQWKDKFLRKDPHNIDRMYVWFGSTGELEVVSEGQGFGMLSVVLMADYDSNAHNLFDNLLRYYRAHPSVSSPYLMAWAQTIIDGHLVDTRGPNSATDGDMDAAYALLLAHEKWESNGILNYKQEALNTINALMEKTIHHTEWTIKLGDWVYDNHSVYGTSTRCSDFMFDHLRAFQSYSGDPRWRKVIDKTFQITNHIFNQFSSNTGLLPDFIVKNHQGYIPAHPNFLESSTDGQYSWNSCRTPWRLGIDYLLNGDSRILPLLQKLNHWVMTTTAGNPSSIKAGFQLDGSPLVTFSSMAYVAPFAVSAAIDGNNQRWLDLLWTAMAAAKNDGYYEDSIRLLSMISVAGMWKSPGSSKAPVARISGPSSIKSESVVTLSGAQSSGHGLTYEWHLPSFTPPSAQEETFTARGPVGPITQVATLTVRDNNGLVAQDTHSVEVNAPSSIEYPIWPEGLGSYIFGISLVIGVDGKLWRCKPFPHGAWANIQPNRDAAFWPYAPGGAGMSISEDSRAWELASTK